MRNKTKNIKLFAFCLFMALVWSCKKAPLTVGEPSSEIRSVDNFNQIVVNNDINVFLSVGPQQVEIRGGANLIKNISADVSGGVLTLHNNNKCDWLRSYKKSTINVYITSPNITYITNNGVGTISSNDTLTYDTLQVETKSAGDINLIINSKVFYAHMFSSADLTLAGKANNFQCTYFAGTGFVYCNSLITNYTYISNNSTGDFHVTSSGGMDVTIYREGNVYYTGNPSPIHVKTYGAGQLIKE